MGVTASVVSSERDVTEGTLLFVDDEANILASLKRLFRPLGYRILTANGGHEGLEVLEAQAVDLVISDMRMPEMDGAAFLEKVAECRPDVVRILLTGYADLSSTVAAINQGRIYKYISKPWEENDIKLTVRRALQQRFLEQERRRLEDLTRKQNEELKDLNTNLEAKVADRTKDLRRAMDLLEKAHHSLKKSYTDSIKVFANLVKIREGEHAGDSRQVADDVRRLALHLSLSDAEAQDVLFAALLRDIGKIGLSDKLIGKPFNALTTNERAEVMKHPVIGEAVLMGLGALREAAKFIRAQHERYDGRGFPDGLSGMAIPLGGRILAVVNDYFALLNGSLQVQRLTASEARNFLKQNRGKRYESKIVDAYLELLGEIEIERPRQGEIPVMTNGLEPGMVLVRDLITEDRILLLAKEHVLDEQVIRKIQHFESVMETEFTIYVQAKGG